MRVNYTRYFQAAVLVLVLCIGSYFFCYLPLKRIGLYYQSRHYKKVIGIISYSSITKSILSSKGSYRHYYYFNVLYKYNINNKWYSNNVLGSIPNLMTYYNALEYKSIYQRGKKVNVYYNPEDPKKSLLIREIAYSDLIKLLIYIVMVLVSLFFFMIYSREYLNDSDIRSLNKLNGENK